MTAIQEVSEREVIERCARVVQPTGPRPCDCDRCGCGNQGNAEAVAAWDAAAAAAQRIRALASSPAETYGCHCDIENTVSGQPDGCVFDNGTIPDCVYATMLDRQGKGKTACEYWKSIRFASPAKENT